MYNSFKN